MENERVTNIFQKYRECARHIRNLYYVPKDINDEDILEDFRELSILMFKHLVLNEFGLNFESNEWLVEPSSMFQVVPLGDTCPIMINRKGQSEYWDHPVTEIKKIDLEMVFIEYFDWDDMDLIDFRYYLVRIIESSTYPDLVGSDALIETIYADVYHESRNINQGFYTVAPDESQEKNKVLSD